MRRRADTRETILEAAREVIRSRGVEAASVSAICETAGFTRGAFYSNFSDRDELLVTIIRQKAAEVGQGLAALPASSDLGELVANFLNSQIFDHCYTVLREYADAVVGSDPELARRLTDASRDVESGVRDELVRIAARAGRDFIIDPDDVMALMHMIVHHSVIQAARGIEPDPARFARTVLPPVLEGITRTA